VRYSKSFALSKQRYSSFYVVNFSMLKFFFEYCVREFYAKLQHNRTITKEVIYRGQPSQTD